MQMYNKICFRTSISNSFNFQELYNEVPILFLFTFLIALEHTCHITLRQLTCKKTHQ